jgi:methylamine dehydrogenase accessory protein MauD
MEQALVVSNVVLWIVVLMLAGVVTALVRQIGVLYERVAPAGALMTARGPAVGEAAPVLRVEDLGGGARDVGGPGREGRSTLLFFLSPTCPVCNALLPALRSVARAEAAWLDVVFASDGPRELPYAVLLDGAGVVRAKGLVNTREHLESLFEAHERDVASLQDFVIREARP